MLTRRQFVTAVAGTAATAALAADASERSPVYRRLPGAPAQARAGKTVTARFLAAERPTSLPCFAGRSLPMWTFTTGDWPPVIRLDLGDQLEAKLENRLPRAGELTSIHWHGIRLPNEQDGVPYLVQPPVRPGEIAARHRDLFFPHPLQHGGATGPRPHGDSAYRRRYHGALRRRQGPAHS